MGSTTSEYKMVSNIDRPSAMNRDTLISHIREVGRRIADDAEVIAPDARYTQSIEISAYISPADSVTTVNYSISRIADPRVSFTGENS